MSSTTSDQERHCHGRPQAVAALEAVSFVARVTKSLDMPKTELAFAGHGQQQLRVRAINSSRDQKLSTARRSTLAVATSCSQSGQNGSESIPTPRSAAMSPRLRPQPCRRSRLAPVRSCQAVVGPQPFPRACRTSAAGQLRRHRITCTTGAASPEAGAPIAGLHLSSVRHRWSHTLKRRHTGRCVPSFPPHW
ncbi:uncharacterized protein LOC123425894 isoform X3 [Hordeum vulgare subsp. vulgare]|uniref:uncharacterized protein LOC123425894 isoform X3 n=1 Tax=Hordeum vulgare subsp. vulgare TaxID=112509 RepID=UPI001D1A52A4|nr:uncharacterized protein LOC123425894 isoform X3 [Hordeum vulgare subsp. vulgare]